LTAVPTESGACARCGSAIALAARFCPSCGAAVVASAEETRVAGDDAAETRLAGGTARPRSGAGRQSAGTATGWLSSSGSISHGRFEPGTVLDGRYRVIGLLGRGGMGEVYRADDLRLGQPVALKLLPEALGRDASRLAQFHNEVRTARHVSHPNVCRVYDIGDADGLLYLTMEYVDGEDLSTSLRRIGRFPEDKGLQIARQLCAGLAAAHERGVLHRDLKPANVMLDGAGNVRIMDFGLAAIGEVDHVQAGTPAYMAPEQLAGRPVTARSDVYALGLLLYELFTGRRAITGTSIAELVRQHESGNVTAPTEIVRTLDPVIERAILRCLEHDPSRRPSSALAVSAALPGGDPLAAALAAGETPSPEMIAAAGGDDVIGRNAAIALAVTAALLLLVIAGLFDRTRLEARVPLTKTRDVLLDRARAVREMAGYSAPYADEASGFRYGGDYLQWAVAQGEGARRWAQLSTGRPAAMWFWHRTSPQPLIPFDDESSPGLADPPLLLAGMTLVKLDTLGRLLEFRAAPPQVDDPENGLLSTPAPWDRLFAAAGLDPSSFGETTPAWTPPSHADERRAWTGEFKELPGHAIRIEAAAFRGRPVWFEIVGPWSPPTRELGPQTTPFNRAVSLLAAAVIAVIPIVAAIVARRNVKAGRGDVTGALRLSAFVMGLVLLSWIFSESWISDWRAQLQDRYFGVLGFALVNAALLYVAYLALEPTVRRAAPHMLVGWSRVLQGRLPDPLVGRDLAAGSLAGLAITLLAGLYAIVPRIAGLPDPAPAMVDNAATIFAIRPVLHHVVIMLIWALQNALIGVLVFAVVQRGIGSARIAALVLFAVFVLLSLRGAGDSGYFWFDIVVTVLLTMLTVGLILRHGLLAAVAMFYLHLLTTALPLTLDSSKLYASPALVTMGAVAVVVGAAIWMAQRPARPVRSAPAGA
jgi:serine/threonine-protein kinase